MDTGLNHRRGLTRFQVLDLAGAAMTAAGLANLSAFAGLTTLNLTGTEITGTGLAVLYGLVNLQDYAWRDRSDGRGVGAPQGPCRPLESAAQGGHHPLTAPLPAGPRGRLSRESRASQKEKGT